MSDTPQDSQPTPIPDAQAPTPSTPVSSAFDATPQSTPAPVAASATPSVFEAPQPSAPETVGDVSPTPIEWQPATLTAPSTPLEQAALQSVAAPAPSAPATSSFAPQAPTPVPTDELNRANQSVPTPILPQPAPVAPSQPASPWPAETIAPEPARAGAATNPVLAMLAGAVLSCVLLGSGIMIGRSSTGNSGGGSDVMTSAPVGSSVNSQSGNAIVRAVAAVGPAVMNVDTTFGESNTTSDFLPTPGQAPNTPREGKGTGFIIDSKRGLMLTNAHVVADAKKIQVTTRDGDKYTGRVRGYDRRTDIAVVELSNKKLPQARLATFKDARDLPIGDWAIAIGNPFAQENTVTVGVLSAVGRTLPVPPTDGREAFQLTDMMQTDAAINPGNSGGPLCNLRGEVIGINTAIIPFGQGLGFTIPINKAKAVADQIIKNGKVLHPYIGIYIKPVTDALQSDYGLPDKNGGLVQSVEPNSPAAKAGLQPGDVVRKLNGQTIKSSQDIVKEIGRKKVGESIQIEVLRNNSVKKVLTLKVGDRPD